MVGSTLNSFFFRENAFSGDFESLRKHSFLKSHHEEVAQNILQLLKETLSALPLECLLGDTAISPAKNHYVLRSAYNEIVNQLQDYEIFISPSY